ncbi:MAG: metallophosphoesterase [Nitrososphaeraceae archaeon]
MTINLIIIYSFTFAFFSFNLSNVFANSPEFNIVAVGDWACNSNTKGTVNSILNYEPEVVLSLGDNSYQSTGDCWLNDIAPIKSAMKVVLGNKDKSEFLSKQYMDEFNMKSQYYSFDYENIHFLALSTNIPYDQKSEQYKFAEKDLKEAASNPNITWIILFLHNPLYTSTNSYIKMKTELIETLHPLFEKNGVDITIQGHVHNYQRTFPLMYNADDPLNPIITDNNDKSYNDPDGTIFLIVGTGGAKLHKLKDSSVFTAFSQDKNYGFLNINLLDNGKTLFGEFIDHNGIQKDNFKITKP